MFLQQCKCRTTGRLNTILLVLLFILQFILLYIICNMYYYFTIITYLLL